MKCAICNRTIKNPKSIYHGIGPVCRLRNDPVFQLSLFDLKEKNDTTKTGNKTHQGNFLHGHNKKLGGK